MRFENLFTPKRQADSKDLFSRGYSAFTSERYSSLGGEKNIGRMPRITAMDGSSAPFLVHQVNGEQVGPDRGKKYEYI